MINENDPYHTTYDPYHPRWPEIRHPEGIKKKKRKHKGNSTPLLKSLKRQLWEQDKRCRYCLTELRFDETTLDHIIPRSRTRGLGPTNKTIACEDCNNRKGSSDPVGEWCPKFLP